ncbi:MAG: patatin-like phospholipase family protein [Paracoccaceae bacterium]
MVKRINIALQGGGAHGAFTWGVLDRLLDDPEIEIVAISGTSAGALNGAALKSGLVHKGRQGARDNLDWLWEQFGGLNDLRLAHWMAAFSPTAAMVTKAIEMSPGFLASDAVSRLVSPYDYGPFYFNPLERIVRRFHYDTVCAAEGPRLFISTTNVRTGKIRVFTGDEIHTDVILASSCLPTVFKALEFKDPRTGKVEAFWDGGYTGNPALWPLYEPEFPDDIVIVNINPLVRDEVPKTPQEIENRVNEISFNASLLQELRSIQFVRELIAEGRMEEGRMKNVRVHMIADDDLMNDLSVATKMVPTPSVLWMLREAGSNAADKFLTDHKADLNVNNTVNLEKMFG